MATQFETIDDYIAGSPPEVQVVLEEVRRTIRNAAPAAEETIAYQMPTMSLDGRYLVHFAGWKHHVGLYSSPTTDEAFEQELARYRAASGTVRLPYEEPFRYDLVARLVGLLVEEREQRGL